MKFPRIVLAVVKLSDYVFKDDDFWEIAKHKCHMYELQKNGLYYQSLTFSPMCGLLKNNSESPNVTIYSLSKYMTIVFASRFIKKGD